MAILYIVNMPIKVGGPFCDAHFIYLPFIVFLYLLIRVAIRQPFAKMEHKRPPIQAITDDIHIFFYAFWDRLLPPCCDSSDLFVSSVEFVLIPQV